MLVLSRKISQRIMIGDGITITIVDVRGKTPGRDAVVRIGIDAPKDMYVHREEVLERIREQEEEQ